MAYTYIVQCSDGTFYTGWTVNLDKRLTAHNEGIGAKYTRCRLPVKLVYFEEQDNQSAAQKREADIKKLSRCKKESLIKNFNNAGE